MIMNIIMFLAFVLVILVIVLTMTLFSLLSLSLSLNWCQYFDFILNRVTFHIVLSSSR